MPEVRVGVAVIVRNAAGQVLMGLRCGLHGPGTWSFPGGHVDFGESPEEAAKRELLEETGLETIGLSQYQKRPYGNTHFRETNKQYITLYFEAIAKGTPEVKEPDKCERWEWFEPDNLPSPLFDPIEPDKLELTRGPGMAFPVTVEFIQTKDGNLALQFNQLLRWFVLDPNEVRVLADQLTKCVDAIEGVEPD